MKKFFRFITMILALSMAVTLFCHAISAADGMSVTVTTGLEGERGDTVEAVFTVESNPGFMALLVVIPQVEGFEIVNITNGSVMRQMTKGKNLLWDAASDSEATGTLFTVTIKIGDRAPAGENLIYFRAYECYNSDQKSVNVEIDPIKINVLGEPLEPETTVAEDETTAETNGGVISPDGSVNTDETSSEAEGAEGNGGEGEQNTNGVETNVESEGGSSQKPDEKPSSRPEQGTENDGKSESAIPDNGNNGEVSENEPENKPENGEGNENETPAPENTDVNTPSDGDDAFATEKTDDDPKKQGGCGSSLSFGALIATILLGVTVFVRKKDN